MATLIAIVFASPVLLFYVYCNRLREQDAGMFPISFKEKIRIGNIVRRGPKLERWLRKQQRQRLLSEEHHRLRQVVSSRVPRAL